MADQSQDASQFPAVDLRWAKCDREGSVKWMIEIQPDVWLLYHDGFLNKAPTREQRLRLRASVTKHLAEFRSLLPELLVSTQSVINQAVYIRTDVAKDRTLPVG